MKKCVIILSCIVLLMSGCSSEFNSVYKYGDTEAKYEAAKEFFARGKFQQASTLLEEIVTIKKGSDEAQECLYMLAMSQYCNRDYEAASETFKKYGSSYPRGLYAEPAAFYVGESLYESSPEPRLDQSPTNGSINAYQQFMIFSPIPSCVPVLRPVCMNFTTNWFRRSITQLNSTIISVVTLVTSILTKRVTITPVSSRLRMP